MTFSFPYKTLIFVILPLDKLEGNSKLAIFWFENNYMKLNTDKCNLLVTGIKYEHS